jgi:serine/threonine protein phosphatase PrpC
VSTEPSRGDPALPVEAAVQLEIAVMSRQGGRDYNEDACGHWHSDSQLCCVVADGAGGHGGGDIAARLAVRYMIERCADTPVSSSDDVRALIGDANREILRNRVQGTEQQNMHTTLVALFVDLAHGVARWGHAGDSRLYAFRGGVQVQRTRDHSVVQSLVDAGMLAPADMSRHPQRSELQSALGSQDGDLLVSVSDGRWRLQSGDVFLLCTDGLWEYIEEGELQSSLAAAGDPQTWLSALEAIVLRQAAHKPKHDNFSALTVWVREGQPPAADA